MLKDVSWGEAGVRFSVLGGLVASVGLVWGGGTRGERREGVSVGVLLMRAGIDLR
jgi:hypothetical protein